AGARCAPRRRLRLLGRTDPRRGLRSAPADDGSGRRVPARARGGVRRRGRGFGSAGPRGGDGQGRRLRSRLRQLPGGESSGSVGVFDAAGHQTSETALAPGARPPSEVPSAVLLPLGPEAGDPLLGVVASASGGPYAVVLRSAVSTNVDLSVTFPKGDGTFVHA